MGDKEEAENDRRKLMNKIFCSALTAVVAGAMLTGCAMPWEKGADDDVAPGGYSYTADSNSEQKQAYRWLIEPTINADNIISFDGSQVDPNNEKNTAYANYSVIRQNGKYGIIDYSGNMVVPAEYDDYYTCWCGEVTLFNIINEKNDEYEYCSIDSSNQVVYYAAEHHDSSPKYYWNSNEEKIYVKDADEEQGEEYTGKKAVVVCEADVKKSDNGFYDISPVSEPLYGLAKKDKLILDMQYTDFYAPAYKGAGLTCIAFENDEGKWGYVGSDGKTIIDFKCDGDMSAYCGSVSVTGSVTVSVTVSVFVDTSVVSLGCFKDGGAVAVMLIRAGMNPWLALIFAFLAGMAAGFITGMLHTALGIPGILASILTQISLYSINLNFLGSSNQAVSVDKYSLVVSLRYI